MYPRTGRRKNAAAIHYGVLFLVERASSEFRLSNDSTTPSRQDNLNRMVTALPGVGQNLASENSIAPSHARSFTTTASRNADINLLRTSSARIYHAERGLYRCGWRWSTRFAAGFAACSMPPTCVDTGATRNQNKGHSQRENRQYVLGVFHLQVLHSRISDHRFVFAFLKVSSCQ